MSNNTEIKLNIGCGYSSTPASWINIDSSFSALLAKHPRLKKILYKIKILPKRFYELPWPRNIVVLDTRKGLLYKENTVKCIYSSHFLEHLARDEADFLLKECYRVLVNGGVIRIIVPDLRSQVESYINKTDHIKMEADNSCVCPANEFLEGLGLYDNSVNIDNLLIRCLKVFQGNKNLHKWMYDFNSLSLKLKRCGFVKIVQKEYLDSRIKDVNLIDNPDRFRDSICIEANKE